MASRTTYVYVAILALLLVWAYFVETDTRRVDGTSMLPTLEPGDLVVIQSLSITQVHVGDIIVYNPPCSENGFSVIHRVIQNTTSGLITKGDNNPVSDQFQHEIASGPITQGCLVGKVVFVIPYVEWLVTYMPGWFSYVPTIVILVIVLILLLREEEGDDEEEKASAPNKKAA
jgi:signal peptidase I